MNKKIIIIIFSAILISVTTSYLILDYNFTIKQNEEAHNNRFVKNCIPGGPDKVVASVLIENKTHTFDLGSCVWLIK